MSSDVSEPKHDPEGSSPEAVLEFLSQHRQGTERGPTRDRRKRRRGGQTALLAVVAAVVIAGAGIVIWRSVGSSRTAAPARTSAPGRVGAPSKSATHTTTGGSRTTAPPRKHKTGAHTTGVERGTEPWNRRLYAWRPAPGRGLPDFYYRLFYAGSSCSATASYSCWKVRVVTRHGCPRGVMLILEETRGDADVGITWGFSRPLAARTAGVVEVDADQSGVGSRVDSMLCRTSQAAG